MKFEDAIVRNCCLSGGCEVRFEHGDVVVTFPDGRVHRSWKGALGDVYVPTPNGDIKFNASGLGL